MAYFEFKQISGETKYLAVGVIIFIRKIEFSIFNLCLRPQ